MGFPNSPPSCISPPGTREVTSPSHRLLKELGGGIRIHGERPLIPTDPIAEESRSMSVRVAVLGATGGQGGAVVRALRDGGHQVRAVVRDPHGARARALGVHGVEV